MSYNNAVQKYGKGFVQQILNLKYPSSAKYIEQICHYVLNEQLDVLEVCRLFRAYDILHERMGLTIDFHNKPFDEVTEIVYANDTNINPLPNQLYLSADKMIEIGLLNSFEDAKSLDNIVSNPWCICHKQDMWDDYTKRLITFYVIRNFNYNKSSPYRCVIAAVYPDERVSFYDLNNNEMTEQVVGYITSLGNGEKALKSKWWDNSVPESLLYPQWEMMHKLGCISTDLFESIVRDTI